MSASPENGVVILVKGLVSAFGDNLVHDGLDLEVRRGEILGVVGGSGSGKSVLLNTLLGLKEPDGGTIQILNAPASLDGPGRRDALKGRIGVLFQGGALFSSLCVRDNVGAPLREHTRLSALMIDRLSDMKTAMTGLGTEVGDMAPSDLSGGMRKRASLARALALDPELLFLDEPTAGLDPIGADGFDQLILGLRDALGLTVVMVTHDLDSLYATTDRVAVLADRKIVAIAPVAELERSTQPWIHTYFLGPRSRAAGHFAQPKA